MAKKERYAALADHVVEYLGGKDNISFFTHCVTRLRFNVKDKSIVQDKEIEKIEGVMGCQWVGDQLQIIIGQAVGDAYNLIAEKTGLAKQDAVAEDMGDAPKKKFSINTIFDAISGSITPLIDVLIGAGFVKIVLLLLEQFGLLTPEMPTYVVLNFVGDAGFYFLPVFIGAMAAKKFGASQGLGMLLGAMLIHPNFVAAVSGGQALNIFGLPIYAATYSSSVIPAILAVAVMAPVQRFFARTSPDSVRSITEPFFTLVVMVPLTLCVLAPLGSFLGTYLSQAILWLYNTTGFFGVAVFACICPWVVMTGMHSSLMPYMLDALATGAEFIVLPGMIISNIDQGAACAAVALKTKNKQIRSTAASCAITAMVGGVTEPGMFGINLRFKTPMYGAMIGSFCGALVAGFGGAAAHAITGSAGLIGGLPIFLGGDISNLIWMVAGIAVGVVVTFIATYILYKPEVAEA
ncbi:MAG TPA: PTS transporter subunit EIIC [Candidatus Coprousia avicola]|nr:PTS transporter subunit EIIC [Candidatus Coprousia avicola]